jgi:hypothetical protein
MKSLLFLLFSFFVANVTVQAQSKPFKAPVNFPPAEKADYSKFKEDFINATNWFENTPFDEQKESRRESGRFITLYLLSSPDVDAVMDNTSLQLMKENSMTLLTVYLGSYARLAFESPKGKQDHLKCAIFALKSVIKFYKTNLNKGLKKDANIVKLIAADEKNELEKWISENNGKK